MAFFSLAEASVRWTTAFVNTGLRSGRLVEQGVWEWRKGNLFPVVVPEAFFTWCAVRGIF